MGFQVNRGSKGLSCVTKKLLSIRIFLAPSVISAYASIHYDFQGNLSWLDFLLGSGIQLHENMKTVLSVLLRDAVTEAKINVKNVFFSNR